MYILSGSAIMPNEVATYLGLGTHFLAWGETRDITVESARRFVPVKLGVPYSAGTAGVDILQIKIGSELLLAAPLPLELLADVSTFPQPRWPEIGPDRPVTFTVRAPLEPPAPKPLTLRWWRRLLNWVLRRKPPAPPALPLPKFTGAFYGALL